MISNSKCAICKKDFYVKPNHKLLGWGKYCSISCRGKSQFNGKMFRCHVCSKSVYRTIKQQKHSISGYYFCTKRCQTRWRNSYYIEEKSANWKNGMATYRNILKRSGVVSRCILCGIDNENILTAHHKDHNRKNNSIDNLVWLCMNCHYLVHHEKDLDEKVKTFVYNIAND